MAEQSKFAVVLGGKATKGVVAQLQAKAEVREATTGQVVRLARVWAVAAAPAPVKPQAAAGQTVKTAAAPDEKRTVAPEELGFYRKYTEALLRRYVQMTMEAGRVSSLMGREVLGGKASSYRIHGFDDAVIFRLDVEKCLGRLEKEEREVIRRIAMQEYTHAEAAELLRVSLRTVGTRYTRSLDRLTQILVETRILEPLKGCQVAGW